MKKIKIILTTFGLLFVLNNTLAMEKQKDEILTSDDTQSSSDYSQEDEFSAPDPNILNFTFNFETYLKSLKDNDNQAKNEILKIIKYVKTTIKNLKKSKKTLDYDEIEKKIEIDKEIKKLKNQLNFQLKLRYDIINNFQNNLKNSLEKIYVKIKESQLNIKNFSVNSLKNNLKNEKEFKLENEKEFELKNEKEFELENEKEFELEIEKEFKLEIEKEFELENEKEFELENENKIEEKIKNLKESIKNSEEIKEIIKKTLNEEEKENKISLKNKLNEKEKNEIKNIIFEIIKEYKKNEEQIKENIQDCSDKEKNETKSDFYKTNANYLNQILKIIKKKIPEITEDTIFEDEDFYYDLIKGFNYKIPELNAIIAFVKKNREFNKLNQKISNSLKKDCNSLYLTKKMTPYKKNYKKNLKYFEEKNKEEINSLKKDFKNFKEIFKNFSDYYNKLTNVLPAFVNIFLESNNQFKKDNNLPINFYKNILKNKEIFSENLYEDFENYYEKFVDFFKRCNKEEKKQFYKTTIKNRAQSKAVNSVIRNFLETDYNYIKYFLNSPKLNKNEQDKEIINALLNYNKLNFVKEFPKWKKMINIIKNFFDKYSTYEKDSSTNNVNQKENLKELFLEKFGKWKGDEYFLDKRCDYFNYLDIITDFMTPKQEGDNNFFDFSLLDEDIGKEEQILIRRNINIADFQENLLKLIYFFDLKRNFSTKTFFQKFKNHPIYKVEYFNDFNRDIMNLYVKNIAIRHRKLLKQINNLIRIYESLKIYKNESLEERYVRNFKACFGLNNLKNDEINQVRIEQFKNIKELIKNVFKKYIDEYYTDLSLYIKTDKKEEKEDIEEKCSTKKQYLDFLQTILNIELFHNKIIQNIYNKNLEKTNLKAQFKKIINEIYDGNAGFIAYTVFLQRLNQDFLKFCNDLKQMNY